MRKKKKKYDETLCFAAYKGHNIENAIIVDQEYHVYYKMSLKDFQQWLIETRNELKKEYDRDFVITSCNIFYNEIYE